MFCVCFLHGILRAVLGVSIMKSRFFSLAVTIAAAVSVIFSLAPSSPDAKLDVLPLDGPTGPESLAFDVDGEGPYTGVSDGRILKWRPEQQEWVEFAVSSTYMPNECRGSQDPEKEPLCGRPLGLQFDKNTGDLYIAEAYKGLLKVSHQDKLAKPIATQAQGKQFHFTNSLDIDEASGVIYFTDSSTRYQRRQFMSAIISGDRTGRLMRYDPSNNSIQVLVEGLAFANGVALNKDGTFLLIAETTTCRILKYQLKPYRTESVEVLVELPGFPDNIKRSPRGGYWVAMHSRRTRVLEWGLSLSWLRSLILKLPFDVHRMSEFMDKWRGGGALAVRIGEDGEVLEMLEGLGEGRVRSISEVQERNGSLWIGSVVTPFVGVYKL